MFSLDPSNIWFSYLLHFLTLSFLARLLVFLPDDVIYVTTAVINKNKLLKDLIKIKHRSYSNGGTSILITLLSNNLLQILFCILLWLEKVVLEYCVAFN
jgi:hypothetical protein